MILQLATAFHFTTMYIMRLLVLCTAQLAITSTVSAASLRKQDRPSQSVFDNTIPSIDHIQEPIQDVPHSENRPKELVDMLDALDVMQTTYFKVYGATWPEAIDWTAAVTATQVSATLSSLVWGLNYTNTASLCTDLLRLENTINRYFGQTSLYFFGENAFSIRNQAYDDMLWVVLGWLENIKFAQMYTSKHWDQDGWHGLQMVSSTAHRARIFYELAENGWDEELCDGGMTWNPALEPYKNAITNELFAAASIAMYLYYPGDNNTSPFMTVAGEGEGVGKPRDPRYLQNAIKTYKWIQNSGMQNSEGLYQDGFHVTGWHKFPNNTINPGTKVCDDLNRMVYTYNQGVLLSASRGLWLATGARSYLEEGYELVDSVIRATGWPSDDRTWHGLGRRGVLEEFCDHGGYCSQDGQTFKGIFFMHLSEFCRPLWPQEGELFTTSTTEFDHQVYEYHLARCAAYAEWIEHNARAALITKRQGLFGMWWGIVPWRDINNSVPDQQLSSNAYDHLNPTIESLDYDTNDLNMRGRGRTVETQGGGLAVLRAHWQWQSCFK